VQETRRDEESGGAVQSPPALVAAEDATNLAHTRRVAQRADDPPQAGGHDRLPTWQDRPQHERHEADHTDHRERSSERRAVRAGRQQDVWQQQGNAADRNPSMPDRGTIDSVEPFLDPRQRADQNETDRQQQDRLSAEELPNVTACWLPRRPRYQPQDGHPAHKRADRRRPRLPGDESAVHGWTLLRQTGTTRSRP
jgi:hypothetical protein